MGRTKKNQTPARSIDSPDSDRDSDPNGENGWVVVKKQRVRILVPALPFSDRSPPKRRSERRAFRPAVDRGLRARTVERKVRRAGGVVRWLESLGLGRFSGLFGKLHVAGLTMKKLEEMGAARAVGPRRKLIHAIDCLCHPHCFQGGYFGNN